MVPDIVEFIHTDLTCFEKNDEARITPISDSYLARRWPRQSYDGIFRTALATPGLLNISPPQEHLILNKEHTVNVRRRKKRYDTKQGMNKISPKISWLMTGWGKARATLVWTVHCTIKVPWSEHRTIKVPWSVHCTIKVPRYEHCTIKVPWSEHRTIKVPWSVHCNIKVPWSVHSTIKLLLGVHCTLYLMLEVVFYTALVGHCTALNCNAL